MIGQLRSHVASWLRSVIHRRRLESEIEEEMRFHLDARAADLVRQGLSASEAARRARVEFGLAASHKDAIRHHLGLRWCDELWGDVRYALRILRKSSGFTVIAVTSLALAIGANTTIFSVANELLYRRLGVPHPEQLRLLTLRGDEQVIVHGTWGDFDSDIQSGVTFTVFSYPVYRRLQEQNKVLGPLFAFKNNFMVNITASGVAQAGDLELVSGNYYEQMGVRPALGRAILPSDDQAPGAGAVAVISDAFWTRTFGRSPSVIGKTIIVNMTPVTIVGVNPPSFTGAKSAQQSPAVFMPLSMIMQVRADPGHDGSYLQSTSLWWVQVMARERPSMPAQQAEAALNVALMAAIRGTMPVKSGDTMPRLVVEDGSRGLNLSGRRFLAPMRVLFVMVGLLLLLACANMANLMLARASSREREMSVRLALGAGRWRILRQVLIESLTLSALGGVLGLLIGYLGSTAVPRLLFTAWERTDLQIPFSIRVYAFTAVITITTGILFGIVPAWASTRAGISASLKQGGKTASRRRTAWSGKAIVAFQVSLSTLLVVAAGLFLRTVINLNSVHPGFRTDHLLMFDISPPGAKYPAPKDIALHAELEAALGAVPGVQGVTLADIALLSDSRSNFGFTVQGAAKPQPGHKSDSNTALMSNVGPQFFSVMEIPILAGRAFTARDALSPHPTAVINESLARKFFPGQNPIGRSFNIDHRRPAAQYWTEIIGVCADTRYNNLQNDPPPIHFDLYRQAPLIGDATYLIRTQQAPEAIVPSLRAAVQRIDPNLPLMAIRTQQQQIDATMQTERMFAALTAGFGLLALALACVGIYGIMAYSVAQRTNEIGIRLALGAQRQRVLTMVLREATWLTVSGVACGLGAALALGRLVQSMLYGLKPADPLSLSLAAALLLAIALTAGLAPAIRAARVEPLEALRHD